MTDLTPDQLDRLLDLLADDAIGALSVDDRAELETLARAAGPGTRIPEEYADAVARVVLDTDDASGGQMPPALRERLDRQGRAMVAPSAATMRTGKRSGGGWWVALAACIAIFGAGIAVLGVRLTQRSAELDTANQQLVALQERVESNRAVLAEARERAAGLEGELARAAERATGFAAQLADATDELDRLHLAIAKYEQPDDPEAIAADRRRLMEVPGTIRVAWSPFDLPDAPAEQGDVQGDVIWNDGLEQGYLRFVGLDVNDPSVEQYQVWIIDERGMEQKVSGGVFSATAEGEVIVPIEPGIDVGRVALFAVTIENPGGTWVPDLSRRVVVGAREAGEG